MKQSKVIERNEKAGNPKGKVSGILEVSMLQEELNELETAFLSEDKVEQVDACIDLIYVAMGTMHKLGLSEQDMENCFNEVCRSNETKFPYTKDGSGKLKKSENYERPNLKQFILDIID